MASRAGELRWLRFVRTAARPSAMTPPCASGARRDSTPARRSRRHARDRVRRGGDHRRKSPRSVQSGMTGRTGTIGSRVPSLPSHPRGPRRIGSGPLRPPGVLPRSRLRNVLRSPPPRGPRRSIRAPRPRSGTSPDLPPSFAGGTGPDHPASGAPSGVRGWMIRMLGGKPEAPAPPPAPQHYPPQAAYPGYPPQGLPPQGSSVPAARLALPDTAGRQPLALRRLPPISHRSLSRAPLPGLRGASARVRAAGQRDFG